MNDIALIITDLQYDMCDGGPMANVDSLKIIPLINSILENYSLVVFSKKECPSDHINFKCNGGLLLNHCITGTHGCELNSDLIMTKNDIVISRCTQPTFISNSVFYEDESTNKMTKLKYLLDVNAINEIHICGNNADGCIFSTAMDALNLGFKVSILVNLIGYIDKDKYEECKRFLSELGVQFV